MLQPKTILTEAGVIVGRFQTDDLHEAHIQLIDTVIAKHDKVIILLGCGHVPGERSDPLDYDARRLMLQAKYPEVIILPIYDMREDEDWSAEVDKTIRRLLAPGHKATLYGSRDSFISGYKGNYPVVELESPTSMVNVSGTNVRNRLSVAALSSREFRVGAIWEAYQKFPAVLPTVDIAILNDEKTKVLLARKPNEKQLRFIGGFSDPKDESFEASALREVQEETNGTEVADLTYIGSFNIKDWRYSKSVNQIRTLFYVATYTFGNPEATDDIEELRWTKLTPDNIHMIVEEHQPLYTALLNYLKKAK